MSPSRNCYLQVFEYELTPQNAKSDEWLEVREGRGGHGIQNFVKEQQVGSGMVDCLAV